MGTVANVVSGLFGARRPKYVEKPCRKRQCNPESGWAGRYHPKKHTITLATGRALDPEMRRAAICHEHAHGATLATTCGAGAKGPRGRKLRAKVNASKEGCTYAGEHDANFYRHLAVVHRRMGTRPEVAERFERMSGYSPPRGWLEGTPAEDIGKYRGRSAP